MSYEEYRTRHPFCQQYSCLSGEVFRKFIGLGEFLIEAGTRGGGRRRHRVRSDDDHCRFAPSVSSSCAGSSTTHRLRRLLCISEIPIKVAPPALDFSTRFWHLFPHESASSAWSRRACSVKNGANGYMVEIPRHRCEIRRQTEKTNINLDIGRNRSVRL